MGSFGTLLRDGREHAGLTQEELAERSGVSVRTVRNLEAGKVGAPRLSSLRSLADAIGADRVAFITTARRGDDVVAAPADALPKRLTSFVGREAEVAEISDLLESGRRRLITITGFAGIGKTRLALAVAERLRDRGRRVIWIGLADADTAERAMTAVADAVGTSASDAAAIGEALRCPPATCVVDNLEHLPDAPVVIERLLSAGPEVAVVATSRAPIGIDGEHERPLGPLAVPPHPSDAAAMTGADAATMAKADAAMLLSDRIRATEPGFAIDAGNAAAIAEICHLLSGMPLALELAARQWRVRGADGLLNALRANPLGLADVARSRRDDHSSVAAALQASYDLLGDDAKQAMRDLATFRGGWTLEAASAVISPDSTTDVVADHDQLLAAGLIQVGDGGRGRGCPRRRFSMLPVVHAFATARAVAKGDAAPGQRHAEQFAAWAASLGVDDDATPDKLRACDDEDDNLRAALDWFADHDPASGLDMAISLSTYWGRRGCDREALTRFTSLLDRNRSHPRRAFAAMLAANHALFLGRVHAASDLARASLETAMLEDDKLGQVRAMGALGTVELVVAPARAIATLSEARELAGSLGEERVARWTAANIVSGLVELGRLDEAEAAVSRLLPFPDDSLHAATAASCLMSAAEARRLTGDNVAALDALSQAAERCGQIDSVEHDIDWLVQRALIDAAAGDLDNAEVSAGEALTRRGADRALAHVDDEVYLAMGEVALARGERAEATSWLRRATAEGTAHLYPMRRIESLAALATATDDDAEAAAALAAIDELRDRLGITLPPVITRRLTAMFERHEGGRTQ